MNARLDTSVTTETTDLRPLFRCDWDNAVFLHFRVPAAELQPFVLHPLDLHDGDAWVSLVAFTMRGLRLVGLGAPGRWALLPMATQHFLNVRTYVRPRGERGIHFLAEWLTSRLSVPLGPITYGLPYRYAAIQYCNDLRGGTCAGVVRPPGSAAMLRYRATALPAAPATAKDEFLIERYLAFTDHRKFKVTHAPWELTPLHVEELETDLIATLGDWFRHARFDSASYSRGVRGVGMSRPVRLEKRTLPAWTPLAALPALALLTRCVLPPWGFMWTMAGAIFSGCKWLTYREAGGTFPPRGRALGYLCAWPGMDARAFLHGKADAPEPREWLAPTAKTLLGALLLVVVSRRARHPLAQGWLGMLGTIAFLHFGIFHLIALAWRSRGIDARPVMDRPLSATSVTDFWSRRWNTAFHQLAMRFVFRPLARRVGVRWATLGGFAASGLVHELVISLPARAGYGLPTAYFLIQGAGALIERSTPDKRLGRAFTLAVVAAPVALLFFPKFIRRVILPFLRAL